jgi:hypothetical protein
MCTLADEDDPEKKTFLVPVSKGDCGSYKKIEKAFEKQMQSFSACIVEENAKHKRLSSLCLQHIEEYAKRHHTQKKGAIVAEKRGFLKAEFPDGRIGTIYIVGKNCALPCSANITREDVATLDLIWIGDPLSLDLRVPYSADSSRKEKAALECLLQYHDINSGTLLLLMGATFLSMNIRNLGINGIKLSSVHVIGMMGTGKSDVAGHVQDMFPREYIDKGFVALADRKMSVSMLSQETAKSRAPNVQDPPQVDKAKFRCLIDELYEAKLPINQKNIGTFENKTVQSNVFVVWKNEDRSLPHFDFTCLTKALVLINEVQDTPKTTLADRGEQYLQHKEASSYLFSYLVREINVSDLKAKAKEIKAMYIRKLSTEYNNLLDYPRVLDTYSLNHAATHLLIEQLSWKVDTVNISEVLKSYILERCLPKLIRRIEQEKKRENSLHGQPDAVEDTEMLSSAINALSSKEFFCNVAFSNVKKIHKVCLAKTWETDGVSSLNKQMYKQMFHSAPVMKPAFSKAGTDSMIPNRHKGDTGDFSRRDGYCFKSNELPALVFNAIVSQLCKVLPDAVKITTDTNIKLLLDKQFKSDATEQGEQEEQDEQEELEFIAKSQEERDLLLLFRQANNSSKVQILEFAAGPDIEISDAVDEDTEGNEAGHSGATKATTALAAEASVAGNSAGNFASITNAKVAPKHNTFF